MGESVEINVQGRSSPEHLLEFTLTNASSEPLTIYEHVLPWVGWTSLMLLAVSTDADGTALEKVPPIDDPGATKITTFHRI